MIYKLLKISKHDYEMLVFTMWLNYCQKKSFSQPQLQMLLSNTPLFNWWLQNLKMFESKFIEDVSPYAKVISSNEALRMYKQSTANMKLYYSYTLIKKALSKNEQSREDKTNK